MIRFCIHMQYGEQGAFNYYTSPSDSVLWTRLIPQDVRTTMRRLFAQPGTAYQFVNHAQLSGLVYTSITPNPADYRGGYIQTSVYVDRALSVPPETVVNTLQLIQHLLTANPDLLRQSIEGTNPNLKLQLGSLLAAQTQALLNSAHPVHPHPAPRASRSVLQTSRSTVYAIASTVQQLHTLFTSSHHRVFTHTPILTIVIAPSTFKPADRSNQTIDINNLKPAMSTTKLILTHTLAFVAGIVVMLVVYHCLHQTPALPERRQDSPFGQTPASAIPADSLATDSLSVDSLATGALIADSTATDSLPANIKEFRSKARRFSR